ncbi:MAG: ComEC/Rec2 family competence protein [candidate division WOR-3 bacterium]
MKLSINLKKVIINKDTFDFKMPVEYYTFQEAVFLGRTLVIRGRILPADRPDRHNILSGTIVDNLPGAYPNRIFYIIGSYIDSLLKKNLPPVHYRIGMGLVLGGSSRVGKELQDVFARAGVLHILAVSGLHVGFVITFLGLLFLFLPLPRIVKFFLIIILLLFYAGITGFRPSVLRAVIMAFFFGLALTFERNVNPIHILNITALFLLLYDPQLLFDPGAQLSFAAVYGILYLYPRLESSILQKIKPRFLKTLLAMIAVSFSAQVFVSPLLIYHFNRCQTLSVFSNVLVVPLSSVIIYLLFITIIIAPVSFFSIGIFYSIISILLELLIYISNFFAHLPFASVRLSIPAVFLILFYLLFVKPLKITVLYIMVALSIMFSLNSLVSFPTLKIFEDGVYIVTPEKRTIFITPKNNSRSLFLSGIEEVDYLIAPQKFCPYKSNFIEYPGRFHYKNIKLGELEIEIGPEVVIKYKDKYLKLDERQPQNGKVYTIITDGKRSSIWQENLRNSLVEQIISDLNFLFRKFLIITGLC